MGNGAAATPSYNFASYTTTGLYAAAGPLIGFSINGANELTLTGSAFYPADNGLNLGGSSTHWNAAYLTALYLTSANYAITCSSAVTLASDTTRKITVSTSDPSGGASGDVWLKYV